MTTLKDIAEKAGVSISTVSRALKNDGAIKQATREKISRIAAELGYSPNQAAQILAGGKRETAEHSVINVIYESAKSLNDRYFSEVIRNVIEDAASDGFTTTVSPLASADYGSFLAMMERLKGGFCIGTILVGNVSGKAVRMLRDYCPNSVLVDKPSREVISIFNDNRGGARRATEYLIDAGCRNIALIHGPKTHYFAQAVTGGYEEALEGRGMAGDTGLYVRGDLHIQSGYDGMRGLIRSGKKFDAVVANDEMAYGAMRAMKEAGIRVPEEVMVFGFDNLELSRQLEPSLSTVDVNYEHMGRMAVQQIIDNIDSENVVPIQIILPVELVFRQSTAGKMN